ncbi:transcription repressor OFP13-like [Juglans microcarpa x Juglans regia]|uniref:transcription repressor OFP13-like n=1 Tax=Juglans microcarpa x Juglans regia TaxID=2249226 RepID=UPI001B7DF1B0|nr:transcription repressor OFP13-like [Juglans microcarpa x Juglans regia]
MGRRFKLPSIFKCTRKAKSSWKWSPFKHLKYISFRAKETKFKRPNSALSNAVKVAEALDSPHARSQYSKYSFSAELEEYGGELMVEMAVKALTSKRLSFEPAGDTSLMTGAIISRFHFQDCVVHAIESTNPYTDFRNSMEEMIEDYGKKDLDYAEDLLAWYLRMNRKNNHGFIVEAFIDMFAGFASNSTTSSSYHASSSSSKSKDWWEIEVESILSCAKNGNIQNLIE